MSKADGVYMSTDYRVTNAVTGKLIDDDSVKFLTIHYPPDEGGPTVLMAYTGLARLRDREKTPMATWIRSTLRGETDVIDPSMAHLKTRLDRDIAPYGVGLIINMFVVEPARRLFGAFTNVKADWSVRADFLYHMAPLGSPFCFANGAGARTVLRDPKLFGLMKSQLEVTPREPKDHMKLLSSINRRAAALDATVSPVCQVSFIPANAKEGVATTVFREKGESAPITNPSLLFGIDLTDIMEQMGEEILAQQEGREVDTDAVARSEVYKRSTERRP